MLKYRRPKFSHVHSISPINFVHIRLKKVYTLQSVITKEGIKTEKTFSPAQAGRNYGRLYLKLVETLVAFLFS